MKKDLLAFFFCIVLSFLAVKPLFHVGLFPTIDNISVVRMDDMARELRLGQFPVRHSSTLARGRGYMLFNFYAPLPFYMGAAQILAGINSVGALKRTYLIAFFLGLAGMYYFGREFFGRSGGVVAALVFLYAPYLGFDTYWRGGLGEVWAISLLPFLFWSSYRLLKTGRSVYISLFSLVVACIGLSHNLTAFMVIPFLGVWGFFWWRSLGRKYARSLVFSGILGLGLASFFWLPAFVEKSFIWVSLADASALFDQLVGADILKVLFPTFIPMVTNWWIILVPLLSAALVIVTKRRKTPKIISIGGLLFLLSLFMVSKLSLPIWKAGYPLLYIFLFSWRFYVMTTFFGALLIGSMVTIFSGMWRYVVGGIIITVAIVVNIANFRPASYEFVTYTPGDPCGTTYGTEYFPTWVQTCLKKPPADLFDVVSGSGTVTGHRTPMTYQADVTADTASVIRIQEYYYPGWQATVDGKPATITYTNRYGLIEVAVPPGRHTVTARLRDTALRSVANMFSVIALIAWCIITVYGYKKTH